MDTGRFDLPTFRRALARRRKMFVLIVAVAAAGGLGTGLLDEREYSSSAIVMIPTDGNPARAASITAAGARLAAGQAVAARAEEALGIRRGALRGAVTATPLTDEMVEIVVAAPARRDAIRRANAVTEQFVRFRDEQAARAALAVADALDERAAKARARIAEIDATIAAASGSDAALLAAERDALREQAAAQSAQSVRTRAASGGAAPSAWFVEYASTATRHDAAPARGGLMGALVGAMLAIGVVMVKEIFDDRVWTRDDAAQAAGAPVVATIPADAGADARSRAAELLEARLVPVEGDGDEIATTPHTGRVLLLATSGSTPVHSLRRAAASVRRFGGVVAGVVLADPIAGDDTTGDHPGPPLVAHRTIVLDEPAPRANGNGNHKSNGNGAAKANGNGRAPKRRTNG